MKIHLPTTVFHHSCGRKVLLTVFISSILSVPMFQPLLRLPVLPDKKNRGKIKWHVFNDIEDVLHHTVTYLVLIVVLFSLFDLDPIRCTCLCAITTIITKMHRPSRCKFKFDITSWILTINRSVIWTSLPDFLSPLGFTNFAHIQSISIDFFLPLSAIRTANQPWRISFILPEACSTLLALIFTIGVNRPSCSTKGTLSYLS